MSLDVPLFFLLKGDHPTLPEAEVKAIMEAEGYDYNLKRGVPQILRCRAALQSCEAVSRRALYTHICAEEIFNSEDREAAIISAIREVNFKKLLEPGERFSLRIRRVRGSSPDINIAGLRNDIGKLIKTHTRASLNLDRPRVKFLGVFSKSEFFFVKVLYKVKGRPMERRAKNREFFHPSTLQPKLAGCMVNLTRVKPPQPLLDPFCGSGAILIEARVLGCSPVGMDISSAMAMGSRRNLRNFNENFHGLILGDARRMPFLEISAIATDPQVLFADEPGYHFPSDCLVLQVRRQLRNHCQLRRALNQLRRGLPTHSLVGRVFGNVEQAMLLKQKPEVHKNTRFGYCRGSEPVQYVRAIRDRYRAYLQVSEVDPTASPEPALTQALGAGS